MIRVQTMYRLIHQLGAGGMGEVYAAHKHADPKPLPVAVKILRPDLAKFDRLVGMFHKEAVTSWRINHEHINLVTVYDFGVTDDGVPYLVMEMVDGVRLEHLERDTEPDFRVTRRIAHDVLTALEHLHVHDLVHRDVTPRNILISSTGIAKLTDLGLVKEQQGSLSGLFGGTPAYSSLEALQCRKQTPTSDLYSLGAVLYERLSGRKPYGENDPCVVLQAMYEDGRSPLPDDVPVDLVNLVDGLMTLDVAQRPYQTAAEAIEQLDGPIATDRELAALVAQSPRPEPDPNVPDLGWPFRERTPDPVPELAPAPESAPAPRRRGLLTALMLALPLSLGMLGLGFGLGRMNSTTVSTTPADIPSVVQTPTAEPTTDTLASTVDEPDTPREPAQSDKVPTHQRSLRNSFGKRAYVPE
jgi:serine/threonine protein kinase